MGHRTAATFGYTALIVQLMLGCSQGIDAERTLVAGLAAMLIASVLGWTTGSLFPTSR
ncbi:MAG: hypothetical protein LW720_15950 [Pirellula sp.]|jgi:hypothetical protein|nr:hypothetical protein [Pirellula sp.]